MAMILKSEEELNKKQMLATSMIGVSLLAFLASPNNVKAGQANCTEIQDNDVRYVNSTFADINPEYYNQMLRGISPEEYYGLGTDSKKSEYDEKSILFGSTEGRVRGGFQNGYISAGKAYYDNGVLQGLAKDKLVNGNLEIVEKYNNKQTMFPTSGETGGDKPYNEILSNWKFPFKKDSDGYFYFDSDKLHVARDYQNKTFKLHDGDKGGFYPFNNCNDTTKNLFFTARFDIPFLMTSDGKVKNSKTKQMEDMVFNFSGDDDVWVFVDNDMVLDIGGTHCRMSASINFAKNETNISSILQPDGVSNKKDVTSVAFKNGKLEQGEHVLKVFYMERAGGVSNLLTRFNLQSSGLEAKYVDKKTNKILDKNTFSGPVGESVSVSEKTFPGYTLVEKPDKLDYTLNENLQSVTFYYLKNSTITAKYVDEISKAEISDPVVLNLKEGDNYSTDKKDIKDYTFDRVEGEVKGTAGREDKSITYYYKYNCYIKANYIDQKTGNILGTEEAQGVEGTYNKFETKRFPNFKCVKMPSGNGNIKFTKKDQTVEFYYVYFGTITTNYIVKETGYKLSQNIRGDVEDTKITTKSMDFDGYKLIEKPEKEEYSIGREPIVVNYYYKKLLFNLKVDMNLDKCVVNQNYFKLKGKIGKVETKISEANKNSDCKIYYTVKVSNTEDRTGSGKLVEKIPANFKMLPEENPDWTIDGNQASIDIKDIEESETREYKIVLTKNDGVDIAQTISNNVEITNGSFEETNLNDNKDKNDLVITPRTGILNKKAFSISIGSLIVSVIAIIAYRIKRHKKSM